jgi:hypothetical protein
MSITADDIAAIKKRTGGFSFFSVDGCHLPEHTVNDTKIAMALTVPSGVIFVDDYYNANWPGVQEGISKLYLNEYPQFVPLVYGHNKLLLCHIGYHRIYLNLIIQNLSKALISFKRVRRFGYDGLTVNVAAGKPYLP